MTGTKPVDGLLYDRPLYNFDGVEFVEIKHADWQRILERARAAQPPVVTEDDGSGEPLPKGWKSPSDAALPKTVENTSREELLALATDLSNQKLGSRTRAVEMLRRLAAKPADDGVREALDAADLYISRLHTSLAGKPVRDMDEVAEHWSQSSRKVRRGHQSPNTGDRKP